MASGSEVDLALKVKDILKEKNIEEIPIEKKELQLKVSHLLQKEFK